MRCLDRVALGLLQCPGRQARIPQPTLAHDTIHSQPLPVDQLIKFEPRTVGQVACITDQVFCGSNCLQATSCSCVAHVNCHPWSTRAKSFGQRKCAESG
jgi:hypothetical protein